MASVKMVNRLALAAFAPEAPYLAAGTMAGAVDLSFSSTANLDIFQLDFASDYRQLVLAGSVASSERFTRLSWGKSPANSEQLPLGTIAGGLVDGNIGLWNPTILISSIANREGSEGTENAFLGHLSKHSGPVSTKVCLLQTFFWACGVPLGCKLSLNQNLVFLLQSCKETSEISQIHGLMIKSGLDLVPFTLSKLLANSIHHTSYAAKIFKYIESPNLYMFNTMLRSYSISDDPIQALVLLNRMRAQSLMLDQFTFVSALKSCARASEIWTGLGVHSVLLRNGFAMFLNVMNSLLYFYCACGCVGDAHKLFDEFPVERDLVSWNTLMGGYLRVHKYSLVVDLFKQLHRDGIEVSVTTILGILSAVGELKGRDLVGEFIHGYCIKFGLSMNLNVTSALISMYGKTGEIGSGHKVFDEADAKDVVLWNCLIDRYAKSGMLEEAFRLLTLMKVQGLKPNSSTFVGLLSVSAACGGLSVGQCAHDYIKQQQLVIDAILGTALINMYTKCGLLKEAIEVFDNVDRKDLMCWTAMISAYGVHGQAENAFVLFQRMEEEGCRPNEVTFLAVLNACSHNGLIAEGKSCFRRMVERYSLSPKVEHYGCVIDLLGRAGLLEEAMKLIKSLPIEEDATAWRALLAACRVYGNISLGEQVKRELEQRFDEHPADALTLTSTYAIAGRMEDRASMLEKNEGKQLEEWKYSPIGKKEVGFSRVAA